MKGVFRIGDRGKIKPHFIGPFEILDRIGSVAYQIVLPPHLAEVHDVFHVSMLRKYLHDEGHIVDYSEQC